MLDPRRFNLQFLSDPTRDPLAVSTWGFYNEDLLNYPVLTTSEMASTISPVIHWFDYERDPQTGRILRDVYGQPIQMIETFNEREIPEFGTEFGAHYRDMSHQRYYFEGNLVGENTETKDPVAEANIANEPYKSYKKYTHMRVRADGVIEIVKNNQQQEVDDIAACGGGGAICDVTFRSDHVIRLNFDPETGALSNTADVKDSAGNVLRDPYGQQLMQYAPLAFGTYDFQSTMLDDTTLYVKRMRRSDMSQQYQAELGLVYKLTSVTYNDSTGTPVTVDKWVLDRIVTSDNNVITMESDPKKYNRFVQAGYIQYFDTNPSTVNYTLADGTPVYAQPAAPGTYTAPPGTDLKQLEPFTFYAKPPAATYEKYFIEEKNRVLYQLYGGVDYQAA
ncbi:MAG: hypothetical protein KDK34_07675, partial [Leptospiraceae bacterium]|nr:hypothetical protein [Leptospiraceae bacterium]